MLQKNLLRNYIQKKEETNNEIPKERYISPKKKDNKLLMNKIGIII